MVGIGEAGYGPVAPTLISDYFSENVRSRMLSIYFVGAPLGSALGLMIGGFLGHHYSWRIGVSGRRRPGTHPRLAGDVHQGTEAKRRAVDRGSRSSASSCAWRERDRTATT